MRTVQPLHHQGRLARAEADPLARPAPRYGNPWSIEFWEDALNVLRGTESYWQMRVTPKGTFYPCPWWMPEY